MSQTTEKTKKNTILRVSAYLFRYKSLFWLTIGLAGSMAAMEIAVPIAIQRIFDGLQATDALDGLLYGVGLIALLYLGSEVFNSLRIRVNNTLEQRVLLEMRRDLHSKLLRLPVSFYDQRKSGEISSRVIEDVAAVERALLDGTEQGTGAILRIVGITTVLFIMQPFLAWFVFLPVPILLIVGVLYSKRSRKVWKRVRESAGDLNSLLVEDIQGNRLIQTFGLQKRESARFETKAQKLRDKTLFAMFRWSIYSPATSLVTKLGFLSIVGVGGYLVLQNTADFTMGKLIAFFLLANMLYQPISQLHGLNHLIAAGRASGERVFEVLDAQVDVDEPATTTPLPAGPIEVTFEQARFEYPGRPAVLDQFELTLEANQVTALVGHTGAGKSTVANLAMRTYDVSGGIVKLSGVDIRQLSLSELHDKVGHVAQDPFLFEGTVRDNLMLAKADATEDEIVHALEQACAWEFVDALPERLDTNIGEKGIRLSQGEKQRLTIARVLLKNPPFVILDEATASVDTITERKIQEALDRLVQQRTVLVIAHRLSTVRRADKIVVMEQGRIIESGSHAALIQQGGHYADLWQHQSDLIPEYDG
ncbi:ABC transporter ATP-binding protein [Coraliomargarita sp. SDUM461004]|uniref:ABC transporter ATP-binding protein n=1 Tax=Thalassobacterium sedimentorum TaxID=3041258 RepID=A0ABU1AIU9_9BACT|nr:ABC transporter ATP-binding protein [Coraliomargarita sp. SDUM461004]MDQ8194698.1 ABC transporter ATP-binding protein [Coraliomargarita sp. SDUM461004]